MPSKSPCTKILMNAAGTSRIINRPMSLGPPSLSMMTRAEPFGLELFADMARSLRSAGMDSNVDYSRSVRLTPKEKPKRRFSPHANATSSLPDRGNRAQVAIVHFQGQQVEGRDHQSAAAGAPGVAGGSPAAEFGAGPVGGLRRNQQVAHLFVPGLPGLAAEMIHHLRGIVVVIGVFFGRRAGRV